MAPSGGLAISHEKHTTWFKHKAQPEAWSFAIDPRLRQGRALFKSWYRLHRKITSLQPYQQGAAQEPVLSGFPTAVTGSVRSNRPAKTSAPEQSADHSPSQLPLPRDALPPRVLRTILRVPRRPRGADGGTPSLFVFTQWCSMARPERTFPWWDREVDRAGKPIRTDVRPAAHEIWADACRRTRAHLADPAQAAELMETTVAQVSRYLDRIGAPWSPRKNGLLMLAFSRALQRYAAKSSRLEPIGGASELSCRAIDHGWSRQVNARLDLEHIIRRLSGRNTTVLALRAAGHDWKEIANLLGTTVAAARNGFWREVKGGEAEPSQ
jgi:predicted transcriptional regulator